MGDSANKEDLEKAFQLIQEGKQQREDGENWVAAEHFWNARKLLQKLAKENPTDDEEQQKIAKLYQQQSQEYLHKTRQTFIEALEVEDEMDEENRKQGNAKTADEYCYCQSLSEDEAQKRITIFSSIFAKELEPPVEVAEKGEQEEYDVKEKQSSIEERLMELNASIPKGFKTSDERMQDINRGLNRLGLSLYTEGPTKPKVEPSKSTSQQVADIIAQAHDEVAMEPKTNNSEDVASVTDQDGSDIALSDDESFNSGVDSVLSDEVPKLENVQKIKDQVAEAQAKLAELVALMDTVPAPENEEEDSLDTEGKKGDPSAFDPTPGKKVLQDARDSLHKALKLWKVKAA